MLNVNTEQIYYQIYQVNNFSYNGLTNKLSSSQLKFFLQFEYLINLCH